MRSSLLAALVFALPIACGGAKNSPATAASSLTDAGASLPSSDSTATPTAADSANGDAGAAAIASTANSSVDAGVPAAPDAHPFAKDAIAAESMIDDAIESRHSGVEKCANEARTRAGDPHAKVSLLIGIDQEGVVIGIKTPKGEKKDEKLLTCVRAALKDAPFPRSHSGVITIKKTYEETLKGQL